MVFLLQPLPPLWGRHEYTYTINQAHVVYLHIYCLAYALLQAKRWTDHHFHDPWSDHDQLEKCDPRSDHDHLVQKKWSWSDRDLRSFFWSFCQSFSNSSQPIIWIFYKQMGLFTFSNFIKISNNFIFTLSVSRIVFENYYKLPF